MPAFEYSALDNTGRKQKGILQGDSARQIRQKLREINLNPLSVTEIQENNKEKFSFRQKLNVADLSLLTRQLATLVSAALPVEEALRAVGEQTEKAAVKKIISAVHARVLEGHSLAVALASFPHVFSPLYRASVAAGEQTGHLDKVLVRLAEYTEKRQLIQQKIKQALIYPVIMLFVSFSIIAFLLTYVVPKITGIFEDSGQALPFSTRLLLGINQFILNYGFFIAILFISSILIFKKILQSPVYRFSWDKFLLKIPILGKMIQLNNTAQFARTLGTLTEAGVSVLEAMRIATDVVINLPMQKSIQHAAERVREGMAIHTALKQTNYFSPMSIYLIASGENSGQLEAMLGRVADYQESEITRTIDIGLTLFEPFLIIFMGGIILFIVLAVLLPIFSLNQLVG